MDRHQGQVITPINVTGYRRATRIGLAINKAKQSLEGCHPQPSLSILLNIIDVALTQQLQMLHTENARRRLGQSEQTVGLGAYPQGALAVLRHAIDRGAELTIVGMQTAIATEIT